MRQTIKNKYENYCNQLKHQHSFRSLHPNYPSTAGQIRRDVRDLVNFSSNDYLGLSRSRLLRQRAISFAQQYGVGATASRLMAGNFAVFEEIEQKLAKVIGAESTLIFAPGYQTNISLMGCLMDSAVLGKTAAVFCDRLNHNSLLQGIKLSGADMFRYRHNDLSHLDFLLQKTAGDVPKFIVSETVFGMDGDRADIAALIQLAKKYDAFLILDDAHAVGVMGKSGFGLASDYAEDVDVIVGTFGKAFGSYGSYVACDSALRQYLINACDGFKYTTALPPMVWGCIDAAIELIPSLTVERARLLSNAMYVRNALTQLGFNTGQGDTHIVPVIVGSAEETLEMDRFLKTQGLLAVAVRPPTVPAGTSRLRLSLSVSHSAEHIEQLIQAMQVYLSIEDQSGAIAA